ncbi:MAG: class A beta-lactamase, subclass A2 [Mariniphaga sp.]
MQTKLFLISILFLGLVNITLAQIGSLKQKIEQVIQSKRADVGVAIYGFEKNDTLSINGDSHFPMQSVYKLHLAFAVLNSVDKGKLKLNQKIWVSKSDLLPDTWSPLREKYPNGNIELPLKEILTYTVSQSDNNGCDLLFRLIGGTCEVDQYMHSIGIRDIAIMATEQEMSRDWNVQFTNWTTPLASIQLLRKLNASETLSKESHTVLWELLKGTSTGKMRLKGDLPVGTQVAHKTGTSGKDKNGISAAVNDIGIICLPNGKRFAISVFVSNSMEEDQVNEKIIAQIAKITWDYYK